MFLHRRNILLRLVRFTQRASSDGTQEPGTIKRQIQLKFAPSVVLQAQTTADDDMVINMGDKQME
jgi:hypothetical protein